MSSITWLHLSDWHQPASESHDRYLLRRKLIEDIKNRTNISDDLKKIDFIVFSGDVTQSGRDQEYQEAVQSLFEPLIEVTGLGNAGWERLFIVPGNHDLNWSQLNDVPADIIRSLINRESVNTVLKDDAKRKALLSPFSNYVKFVSSHLRWDFNEKHDDRAYYYVHQFEVDTKKVTIVGLNSAWFSACNQYKNSNLEFLRKKQATLKIVPYGNLILGEPQVSDALDQVGNTDFCIAIMHHPLNWLTGFDRFLLEEHLYKHCHFILHGHEHYSRVNVISSTVGDTVTIPAGASYSQRHISDPRHISSYNFVHLDCDTNEGTVYMRRWKDQQKQWDVDETFVKDGTFVFALPKLDAQMSYVKRQAQYKVLSKFKPLLHRRFMNSWEIDIKHKLVSYGDIKLVQQDVDFRIEVAPGNKDIFTVYTQPNAQVANLLERAGIDAKVYQISYFRVNNSDSDPSQTQEGRIMYSVELNEDKVFIEYGYTSYDMPQGTYFVEIGHFTNKFKLQFQEEEQLHYDYRPIAGFPCHKPVWHRFLKPWLLQATDLHPGQGYLIQWGFPFEWYCPIANLLSK